MPEKLLLQCARFNVSTIEMVDREGRHIVREVIRHPGAVVLLPLLGDGRIVMIDNYRRTVEETLLELPAGTIDPGEPPEQTAARELSEETGYRAAKLEKVHEFYSCPGICDELMHLYVATGLEAGEPNREATEQIENRILGRDEVVDLMARGAVRDAKTLVGLYVSLQRYAQ
jgi:ADP-ribose pyrophosphatase